MLPLFFNVSYLTITPVFLGIIARFKIWRVTRNAPCTLSWKHRSQSAVVRVRRVQRERQQAKRVTFECFAYRKFSSCVCEQ